MAHRKPSLRIVSDIQSREVRKKEQRKKEFKRLYGRSKTYTFPPVDKISMEKHFYFPKLINEGRDPDVRVQNWPIRLSKAALAVYPVLCARANFEENEWFQIPQEEIAKKTGAAINTVTKGIQDLLKSDYSLYDEKRKVYPLLKRKKRTKGERHFYVYKVSFFRKALLKNDPDTKGNFFIFHTCIVDSGKWAGLSLKAKALYIAMRMRSFFDPDMYAEIEYQDFDNINHELMFQGEEFRKRNWDVCITPLTELCKSVGISRVTISGAVKELEKYRLVERVDRYFMVYLKPKIR